MSSPLPPRAHCRYVFLDYDGVIATNLTYHRWYRRLWTELHPGGAPYPRRAARDQFERNMLDEFKEKIPLELFDPNCCARVQALCELANAHIVISSSWRNLFPLDALRAQLIACGITAEVVGATPNLDFLESPNLRGLEIESVVIAKELVPTDIVVLEDVENVAPFNGRRVQTTFDGAHPGFGVRHLRTALKLFGVTAPPTPLESSS